MSSIPFFLIHEFYPQNAGFNVPGITRMAFELDKDGYIGLPPGPGLGVEVDEPSWPEEAAQAADLPLARRKAQGWLGGRLLNVDRFALQPARGQSVGQPMATRGAEQIERHTQRDGSERDQAEAFGVVEAGVQHEQARQAEDDRRERIPGRRKRTRTAFVPHAEYEQRNACQQEEDPEDGAAAATSVSKPP